jgi:hypothetical protein
MGAGSASPSDVQLGQFVGERVDVGEIAFADGLDLPVDAMESSITPCVTCVALDAAVFRVDVELDAPLERRDREIDMDLPTGVAANHSGLALDRNVARS